MATKLTRPVSREVLTRVQGKTQEVIITVYNGAVSMRIKGTRTTYTLPWGTAFSLGAKLLADAKLADKRARKRTRRSSLKVGI